VNTRCSDEVGSRSSEMKRVTAPIVLCFELMPRFGEHATMNADCVSLGSRRSFDTVFVELLLVDV